MCQVHTGAYVSLLAPGKNDYEVYRLPPRKDYHECITCSTCHYAYARQTQANWKNKQRKEKKKKERKENKRKRKRKRKERKDKNTQYNLLAYLLVRRQIVVRK